MGRRHIMDAKCKAEQRFTVAKGFSSNALVLGGDTDSVRPRAPLERDERR